MLAQRDTLGRMHTHQSLALQQCQAIACKWYDKLCSQDNSQHPAAASAVSLGNQPVKLHSSVDWKRDSWHLHGATALSNKELAVEDLYMYVQFFVA